MNIKYKAFGIYQSNTYIVSNNDQQIIIDPGFDCLSWIEENAKNPVAILNTHAHSDHIWSNNAIKKRFNIPIICPKDDVFMLENDFLNEGYELSQADIKIQNEDVLQLIDLNIKILHFPGHTPGSSVIVIENVIFTGDFVFKGSIGRTDFPFGNTKDMKKSIKKFLKIKEDFILFTGHGEKTSLQAERENLQKIINLI